MSGVPNPCLSFKDGEPFAKIDGGKLKGEVLFIDKECKEKINDENLITDIVDNIFKKKKGFNRKLIYERQLLEKHLRDKKPPVDEDMEKMYNEAIAELAKRESKEIKINDGLLKPVPSINTRDCYYISAPSGAGKSVFVNMYCENYHKIFPKNNIYLFSKVENDPAFEKLVKKKIMSPVLIDETLITEPITTEELKNSLCVFDDIDTLKDKQIRDTVIALIDDILQTGRHTNTYILRTSHQTSNYRQTAITLNESTHLVIFPKSSGRRGYEYVMKEHIGLDKETIKKIFDLPTRWACIAKNYPQFVYYETGAFMVQ